MMLLQNRTTAMEASIGGNFALFGEFQRELLVNQGLREDSSLLDIGCGSGRLAAQLRDMQGLRYTGVDVVPELLNHARKLCSRSDWRFEQVSGFTLPLEDASVDMVCAFSVFTHLLHEESFAYLAEARRVLEPHGKIVFTFLEFGVPEHHQVFYSNLVQLDNRIHLNQFVDPVALRTWADILRLDVVALVPGNQPYIHLDKPVRSANGQVYEGDVTLGQSLCVLQKNRDTERKIVASLPKGFDSKAYLAANPDVAAAGVEPGAHYLAHGQFEDRKLRP